MEVTIFDIHVCHYHCGYTLYYKNLKGDSLWLLVYSGSVLKAVLRRERFNSQYH